MGQNGLSPGVADVAVDQADIGGGWLPLQSRVLVRCDDSVLLDALCRQLFSAQAVIDVVAPDTKVMRSLAKRYTSDSRVTVYDIGDWRGAGYHLAICDASSSLAVDVFWHAVISDGRLIVISPRQVRSAEHLGESYGCRSDYEGWRLVVADKPVATPASAERSPKPVSQLSLF
jgi:hypothetical protein